MLATQDFKQIKLVFVSDVHESGRPIFKSRIYRNVNPANASLENVYAFGQAVAALTEWPLDQVILTTDQDIVEVLN